MSGESSGTPHPRETDEEKNRRENLTAMQRLGPLLGGGIQLAAAVVLMFFIGRWLDEQWHTSPWMVIAGSMFGVAAGMFQLIRAAIEVGRREDERSKLHRANDSGSGDTPG